MARWEKIERVVLLVVGFFLLAVIARLLLFAKGHPLVLLLVPVAFWVFWQAFYEDKLEDKDNPTKAERFMHAMWVWGRRLLCWPVGLAFIFAAGYAIYDSQPVMYATAFLILGGFFFWTGALGSGKRENMSDDLHIYRLRKKRYKRTD